MIVATILALVLMASPEQTSRLWCICEGGPTTYSMDAGGRLVMERSGVVQFSAVPTDEELDRFADQLLYGMELPSWRISRMRYNFGVSRIRWTVEYTETER